MINSGRDSFLSPNITRLRCVVKDVTLVTALTDLWPTARETPEFIKA